MAIHTRPVALFKSVPVLGMIKRYYCRSVFRAKFHVAITEACKTILMTGLTLRIAHSGKRMAFSTMFRMASSAWERLLVCSPTRPQQLSKRDGCLRTGKYVASCDL